MKTQLRLPLVAFLAALVAWPVTPARAGAPCGRRCSAIVTIYFGVETPIPDPAHPFTVDLFHTDVATPYQGGAWRVFINHDDVPGGTEIDPEEALLYANVEARFQLASIPPGFEFIGAQPNEVFWILPQSPDPDVLYLGMSTEAMSAGDIARICTWNPGASAHGADVDARWIRVNVLDVRGPPGGHFSMWQTAGPGSPRVHYSTFSGGITGDDVFYILAGAHAHMNWAFTKPGLFEVDVQVSAPTTDIDGDLDDDGDVDELDLSIFAAVLVANDADPAHRIAADLNCDGRADGLDIMPFVAAMLG